MKTQNLLGLLLTCLFLAACNMPVPPGSATATPSVATAFVITPTVTLTVAQPLNTETHTPTPVVPTVTNTPKPTSTVLPGTATKTVLSTIKTAISKFHGTTSKWEIQYFAGVTDEMKDWTFKELDPEVWPEFPNVDNGSYKAAQGLEYGEDLTTFCQYKETCDFVVPARHYRIYSGDYSLDGVGSCEEGETGKGCALMVINVGEVTASFEDQHFDAGFTVWGRYWDGKYLNQAIWAGLSHVANNMLNLDSTLNPTNITNAGANCSVPGGCISLEATFVVTSGNQILVIGRSKITR